jgi:hypothetical protein
MELTDMTTEGDRYVRRFTLDRRVAGLIIGPNEIDVYTTMEMAVRIMLAYVEVDPSVASIEVSEDDDRYYVEVSLPADLAP